MRALGRIAASSGATVVAIAAAVLIAPGLQSAQAAGGFGYGSPEFVNSAAPSTFFDSQYGGEPSVGVNWNTGAALYMADVSTFKLNFDNNATPPGVTWSDVSSPYSQFNVDPILAMDSKTGLTLAGGDDGACAVMSSTSDDGATWKPSVPCPFTADHPSVGVGPFAGTPPLGASGSDVAYFCQQTDLDECSHSWDGGTTWSPSIPTTECAGLHGHIKVSADGTAYLPSVNCVDNDGNLVVGAMTTTDNGLSFGGYGIPGATEPARGFDPSIATTPDNTVYESWSRDGDYHPVVTWSHDHGQTWAPQVDLANTISPPLSAATFEAATAGDNGRAAVAYLGTWEHGTDSAGLTPFDPGYHGVWYLFVSYTYDGGNTWQTVQATPEPVQRGSISDGGTTSSGQRNLLDFIDASVTKDGRVVVAYADGCLATCNGSSGTEAQSTNQWATVAYQSSGQGLFAAYDTAAPVAAPSSPTLTASTGVGNVALSWNAPSDGGAPITGYQVLRGTSPGNATAYATVTDATSFTDSAVTPGTTYYYRVAATNSAGSGAPSNEVSATPTTTPSAPSLSASAGKGQVALSWSTPYDGGAPITGYAIYRGTSPGSETLIQTISSGTTYVDATVTGGTTYYYRVAAANRNGTGARSNEVGATPRKGGR